MTAMHAMAKVRSWHQDATHVIAIVGELDHRQVARVSDQVAARFAGLGADESVALDLDGVTSCSASGVRWILGLLDLAESNEIAAHISQASRPVRQLLRTM